MRGLVVLLLLGVWVATAPSAEAGNGQPVPAIGQYVEELPTSNGPVLPASGRTHVHPLPPRIEKRLSDNGGSDAKTLKTIATSSAYGAPQTTLVRPTPASNAPKKTVASFGIRRLSLDGAGENRLLLLLGLMAGSAAVLALARRRSTARYDGKSVRR